MAMTWERRSSGALAILLASVYGACGFSTAPGAPYDFNQLEPVIKPILGLSSLELLERREFGTDCHGQGCERPHLTYTFSAKPPVDCEFVKGLPNGLPDVTKEFLPNAPNWCAFGGEVQGHGVTVAGYITQGGDLLHLGDGTAQVVQIAIFANRLNRRG